MGKARCANRGGKRKELYAALARAGQLRPTPGGSSSSGGGMGGKGGQGGVGGCDSSGGKGKGF